MKTRSRSFWIGSVGMCLVLSTGLTLPSLALAPPAPGPKRAPVAKPLPPANRTPQPPAKAARAHPRLRPGPYPPFPDRYVRRTHYWEPFYGPAHRPWVWGEIGYGYYVGGSPYVVSPPPTVITGTSTPVDVGASPSEDEPEGEAGERYGQMQELMDVLHEWRTMNESAALHDRIPAPGATSEARATVASIREKNRQFDKTTRAAMRNLASGRSAGSELDSARSQIENLIRLVDSLPGPTKSKATGSTASEPTPVR